MRSVPKLAALWLLCFVVSPSQIDAAVWTVFMSILLLISIILIGIGRAVIKALRRLL